MRVHYGPGYRVYFLQWKQELFILLAGGSKSTQSKDIKTAAISATAKGGNMKTMKFRNWDVVEYLKTEEDMVLYFDACLEEGDPALITAALGDIARAKGMSQVARDAGISREGLYKALSSEGNPEFATVLKVMKALGLKLHATV